MLSFKRFLKEEVCPADETPVTSKQLAELERMLDKMFNRKGLDIEFTRHFFERVNDPRNKRQITVCELEKLFKEVYQKHAKNIAKRLGGYEAVLTDVSTKVNVPFVLRWNSSKEEVELVSKTVMRKKGFKTTTPRYTVK